MNSSRASRLAILIAVLSFNTFSAVEGNFCSIWIGQGFGLFNLPEPLKLRRVETAFAPRSYRLQFAQLGFKEAEGTPASYALSSEWSPLVQEGVWKATPETWIAELGTQGKRVLALMNRKHAFLPQARALGYEVTGLNLDGAEGIYDRGYYRTLLAQSDQLYATIRREENTFPGDSFDLVVSDGLLASFDEDQAALLLQEGFDALKVGGAMIHRMPLRQTSHPQQVSPYEVAEFQTALVAEARAVITKALASRSAEYSLGIYIEKTTATRVAGEDALLKAVSRREAKVHEISLTQLDQMYSALTTTPEYSFVIAIQKAKAPASDGSVFDWLNPIRWLGF